MTMPKQPPEPQLVEQMEPWPGEELRHMAAELCRAMHCEAGQITLHWAREFLRENFPPPSSANTPGSILNECIAELGDSEPFVVSRDGDGWAVRTMSGWRVLQGGMVDVRKIETVAGDFYTEPGEPFWRIEIDGYCADFDYEEAARNFARAINSLLTQPTEDKSDG